MGPFYLITLYCLVGGTLGNVPAHSFCLSGEKVRRHRNG